MLNIGVEVAVKSYVFSGCFLQINPFLWQENVSCSLQEVVRFH